jgi:hypothetical protein
MVVCTCHPSYPGKHKEEDCRLNQHKARPYLKITNVKRAGRVSQVVEHLLSKYNALNSIPSTTKKKKKGKKELFY